MIQYTLPQLLKVLLDQDGSDLHITCNSPPRIRIRGNLLALDLPPMQAEDTQRICYSVLTEDQKKEFESLVERDNVIITPHIGGWSLESYEKISQVLAKKMNAAYESLAKKGNVLLKE